MRKVHVIPASIQNYTEKPLNRQWKRKVAGYARVSTDKYEQLNSLENQVNYFEEMIREKENWEFIDGYVDEGISGTSTNKRDSFNRMIKDAKEKKSTMDTYWIPGVNNLKSHGRWAFAELTGIYRMESDFNAKIQKEIDAMIEHAIQASSEVTPVDM